MALLNTVEIARVEAAIEAAEAKSAGELVVAVVGRSDRYDLPRVLAAGATSLLMVLVIHLNWPMFKADALLIAQIPLCLLFWRLFGLPAVLRLISVGTHTDAVVRRRAMQMFMAYGLNKTRDQSGLLIMISEMEHRVVILGDAGIDAHIGQSGWQDHVNTIVRGIKKGQAGEALVKVLQALSSVLAQHLPRRADDTNELSNKVIIEP